MSLIRIQEPYFKFLIKKQFYAFFGILMHEKDIQNSQNYINDSLATFLTSSLNVELVHVILESITKHSKGQLRGVDYPEYLKEYIYMFNPLVMLTSQPRINSSLILYAFATLTSGR